MVVIVIFVFDVVIVVVWVKSLIIQPRLALNLWQASCVQLKCWDASYTQCICICVYMDTHTICNLTQEPIEWMELGHKTLQNPSHPWETHVLLGKAETLRLQICPYRIRMYSQTKASLWPHARNLSQLSYVEFPGILGFWQSISVSLGWSPCCRHCTHPFIHRNWVPQASLGSQHHEQHCSASDVTWLLPRIPVMKGRTRALSQILQPPEPHCLTYRINVILRSVMKIPKQHLWLSANLGKQSHCVF